MPYVVANDYSGWYGNGLATQAQDASNYFNFARLQQQAEQQSAHDDFQQQQLAQQAEANRLARAQAQASFDWNRTHGLAQLGLQQASFDWNKQRGFVGDRQLTVSRSAEEMKQLMPLADQGLLDDSHMAGLLPEHQQVLKARNATARTLAGDEYKESNRVADLKNEQKALEYQIAQHESSENLPGYLRTRKPWGNSERAPGMGESLYNQRQRMLDVDLPAWKKKLAELQVATDKIGKGAEEGLMLNESGWWQPKHELPWMRGSALPSAPRNAGAIAQPRSQAEYAALPSGTRFLDPNGQERVKP